MIATSSPQTGYIKLRDIPPLSTMVQTASASSSASPSSFPSEEGGAVDNPREVISESITLKDVQGNDFHFRDLFEHKTQIYKTHIIQPPKENIKMVVPQISKAKVNKQSGHLSI